MKDLVILCTRQTYDRSSIGKWVASGNTPCLVTMQKLDDFTLIPNHILRRLIHDWCVANRSRGVERITAPKHSFHWVLFYTNIVCNEPTALEVICHKRSTAMQQDSSHVHQQV